MTTPRKRAPGGGRKPITPGGMVRKSITLTRAQWAHIDAQAGRSRSERARVVVEEHMGAKAPKFIDAVQALGEHVSMRVPQADKFVVTPAIYDKKTYSLKWIITLDSGAVYDFEVIVTDDGADNLLAADDVDTIVQTLKRTIAQWEYEELLRRPR